MNERIRELKEQARDFYLLQEDLNCSIKELHELVDTKFAELIVKECADIAKHHVMNISTYADAEFVEEQIEKHFGVEP